MGFLVLGFWFLVSDFGLRVSNLGELLGEDEGDGGVGRQLEERGREPPVQHLRRAGLRVEGSEFPAWGPEAQGSEFRVQSFRAKSMRNVFINQF